MTLQDSVMERIRLHYRRRRAYLLVNDYNILSSWSVFERKREEDFENARRKLMDILVDYARHIGRAVISVFDGYKAKENLGEELHYKGIRVVFTKAMQAVDHHIEQELTLTGCYHNVRVAISDPVEQQVVLSRGDKRTSVRELEVGATRTKEGLVRRKRQPKSESKVNAWGKETLELLKDLKDRLDPH